MFNIPPIKKRDVFLSSFLILFLILNPGFGQKYQEEDVSDKVKALKIELEELRQQRDRVIAKRWEDRRVYNDAREKFNDEYEDLKEKLELRNGQLDRLREQIEVYLRDVEELKAKEEAAKIQYLGLSTQQRSVLNDLRSRMEKEFPLLIPERQKWLNDVSKSIDEKKDSPEEVLNDVLGFFQKELNLSRTIELSEKGFIRANQEPGEGLFLRIGMVGAAYLDNESKQSGLLLRNNNTTGRLFEWRENITDNAKQELDKNLNKITTGKDQLLLIPMDVLRTRSVAAGYTAEEKKGIVASAKSYLKDGGIWMWPLALIAIAALLLLIERYVFWIYKNSGKQKLLNNILDMLKNGDIQSAKNLCHDQKKSSVANAMLAIINQKDSTREMAEKNLQEILYKESPALEKRLATISVLGAAAPLLGLLGTVAGMIELFESITLYGTSDPKLMASGISVALITTQAGLAISVPILIAHNFIANRMDGLVNKMESYALKTLNILWPKG